MFRDSFAKESRIMARRRVHSPSFAEVKEKMFFCSNARMVEESAYEKSFSESSSFVQRSFFDGDSSEKKNWKSDTSLFFAISDITEG